MSAKYCCVIIVLGFNLIFSNALNASILSLDNGFSKNTNSQVIKAPDGKEWLPWSLTSGLNESDLRTIAATFDGGGWEVAGVDEMVGLYSQFGYSGFNVSPFELFADRPFVYATSRLSEDRTTLGGPKGLGFHFVEPENDLDLMFMELFGITRYRDGLLNSVSFIYEDDPFQLSQAFFKIDPDFIIQLFDPDGTQGLDEFFQNNSIFGSAIVHDDFSRNGVNNFTFPDRRGDFSGLSLFDQVIEGEVADLPLLVETSGSISYTTDGAGVAFVRVVSVNEPSSILLLLLLVSFFLRKGKLATSFG